MRPRRKSPASTQWSESLRHLRREYHVSQAELAKKAKLSKGTISGIESGLVRTPSYRTQRHLDWVRHQLEMARLNMEVERANKLLAIRAAKPQRRKQTLPAPVSPEPMQIGA